MATKKKKASASKKATKPTVILVDGSGYVFRAYYAMRRLSTSKGQSTNAVFGFTTMLMRILREREPSHIGIAFDVGGKTFRHEIYPEYKGNRGPPPQDLPSQIPLIHQLVEHMRIPKLIKEGFEADDVLATVAQRCKDKGYDVLIITGDKDLMQLVDDKTMLLDELRMTKGTAEQAEVRRDQVVAKFGVPPEHVVDVLALAGDASDNVPGVDGIGEKTASELVRQYGALEDVLAHAKDIKAQARREKLIAQADRARLSLKLVTINQKVPIDVDVEDLTYQGVDKQALRNFFHEMEFRRLENDPMVRSEGDGELFAPKPDEQAVQITVDRSRYRAIVDDAGLRELVTTLGGVPRLAVRSEIDKPGPDARLFGVSVAWGDGDAVWLPVDKLGADALKQALAPILADTGKQIVAHDGKTDVNHLFFAGYPTWRLAGDPMLASYLLDADAESHTLLNVSRRFLGHAMIDPQSVLGTGKAPLPLSQVPEDKLVPFVCEAVDCTLRAANVLEPRLDTEGVGPLYRELELPLEGLLGEMERAGIKVDVDKLKDLSADFQDAMFGIEERAYEAAGHPFHLGSPQQIAELLFKELKLPIKKRTASGAPSTDVSVLEQLAELHDLPALIVEHRTVSKLKNTYLDVLPTLVDGRGRVHTHFNQAVAATGRLSSTDPNLQNIPVRTALGRKIRDAFIPEPGKLLVSLDYSQIELRILAHVTRDPVLVGAFQRGEDVHRRTASEVFQVPISDVSKDQRNAAKAINFGLLYGMGVWRLARELGIPRAKAAEYHQQYNDRLVGVRDWKSKQLEQAYADKEVRTILGRRRKLHGITSANRAEAAAAERLAVNTPIQGSAADIMKRAMIDADRALKKELPEARMLLQVHDELVLEVPTEQAQRAIDIGRAAMQNAVALSVPLVVDGHSGKTWNDAH